jgi:hypothetical protein
VTAKNLVLNATTELFGHRDLGAIDRAWAAGYVEHSTLAGPGLDGLRTAASSLPAGFRHERLRVLSQDELVVVHGLYHGLARHYWTMSVAGPVNISPGSSCRPGRSKPDRAVTGEQQRQRTPPVAGGWL